MTLGIMQPYFLPYLGYFSLIKVVDEFVLFDTPQFIRHGWIERNQILKPNGEKLYIKVPLNKHSRETTIKDISIRADQNWKQTIISQLGPYKKKAPYYGVVVGLLEEIFALETDSIVALNEHGLKLVCNHLGINTPIKVYSEMDLEIDPVNAPDEWALNICKAYGASAYYNPTGGMEFFERQKYAAAGIELKFVKLEPTPYKQLGNEFVPFLSVVDVLMFNPVDSVNQMLDQIILLD